MRTASQLDFIIKYTIKLLDKCEPSPCFAFLSHAQQTAAKSAPRKSCVLPACVMHQGCGTVVCTKPEQLRKYFQMTGACPLLLLGTLPLSHERAQASVLEARGAASSQHLPRSYSPARFYEIHLLTVHCTSKHMQEPTLLAYVIRG